MIQAKTTFLFIIGISVNMVFGATTTLIQVRSIPYGKGLGSCIRNEGNEYLISAWGGTQRYGKANIDETGDLTNISNGGFTSIYSFDILDKDNVIMCGNSGIGIVDKNSGNLLFTDGKNDASRIYNFLIIKDTEYLCLSDDDNNNFQVLNKNTLSFIKEVFINLRGGNFLQKGFTNIIYIMDGENTQIKSIDYTNLQFLNFVNFNQFINDGYIEFSSGRTKNSILMLERSYFVFEVNEIEQTLIQKIRTISFSDNNGFKHIFESEFVIVTSDISVHIINLETQLKEQILTEDTGIPCFNQKNLLMATSMTNFGDSFDIFEFDSTNTCEDPNCLKCGFGKNKCLKCGNGKMLENSKCVDRCSIGRYYHLEYNVCYLDYCLGNSFYLYEKDECLQCPEGKILARPEKICMNCSEKNENCSKCIDGTLECEECQSGYFLQDRECKPTCKTLNTSCKEFDEDCNCITSICESKGCTKCSKSPKICENGEIIDKRNKADSMGNFVSGIINYATPPVEIVTFVTSLLTKNFGTIMVMSINRLVFTRRFMYINLNKGELIKSYLKADNKKVNDSNEKNMKFVSNKFFEYVKSIYPSIPAYFKLILVWVIPLALLIGLMYKEKKAGNKTYCLAIFYLKKGSNMINLTSVTDFGFYIPGIINNLDLRKSWWNIVVWILSVFSFIFHWFYQIKIFNEVNEAKASEVRIELEALHSIADSEEEEEEQENEEEEEEQKAEEEKKEKIDIEKTKKVIDKMNYPTIEFIQAPLRNKSGFEFSKHFQLINILRNQIFLTLITAFPQLPQIIALIGIFFEAQYMVYYITIMYIHECFRPINLLQNLIHSFNIFISYFIMLILHYSEKKSVALQNFLLSFNFICFLLEIIFLVLNLIVARYLKSHLDKKEEKRIRMEHAYILEVIFI